MSEVHSSAHSPNLVFIITYRTVQKGFGLTHRCLRDLDLPTLIRLAIDYKENNVPQVNFMVHGVQHNYGISIITLTRSVVSRFSQVKEDTFRVSH